MMRVGLLHFGQSVDFVVSITFLRSPVSAILAIFALVLLLRCLCSHPPWRTASTARSSIRLAPSSLYESGYSLPADCCPILSVRPGGRKGGIRGRLFKLFMVGGWRPMFSSENPCQSPRSELESQPYLPQSPQRDLSRNAEC